MIWQTVMDSHCPCFMMHWCVQTGKPINQLKETVLFYCIYVKLINIKGREKPEYTTTVRACTHNNSKSFRLYSSVVLKPVVFIKLHYTPYRGLVEIKGREKRECSTTMRRPYAHNNSKVSDFIHMFLFWSLLFCKAKLHPPYRGTTNRYVYRKAYIFVMRLYLQRFV